MNYAVRAICCCASVAILASGCGTRRPASSPPRPWSAPALQRTEVPLSIESTTPGTIRFDIQKVPLLKTLATKRRDGPNGDGFLRLTADDCLTRAASVAPADELLEWEEAAARKVAEQGPGDMRALAAFQRQLLALRRQERQSQAALEAVTRFYQLADAELQLRAVVRIAQTVQTMIDAAARVEEVTGNQVAQRRGFDIERLELRDQEATLSEQSATLQHQLRTSLRMTDDDVRRISPAIDAAVETELVDTAAAVATAQLRRVELQCLRLAIDQLSESTLPAVRTVLGREEQALGTMATPASARNTPYAVYEVQVRAEQLAAAIVAAEQRAATEVQAAAAAVDAASLHIARAKEIGQLRAEDLQLLERKEKVESNSTFAVGEARIAAIRAEAELQHEILERFIALARLHAACGSLVGQD